MVPMPRVRIVAGAARGRRLKTLDLEGLRPTLDRVREALFSILGNLAGSRVLDLFAGTGALGIEALSRGAERAVFVDHDRRALGLVAANLESAGLRARSASYACALPEGLQRLARLESPFDVIFLDP